MLRKTKKVARKGQTTTPREDLVGKKREAKQPAEGDSTKKKNQTEVNWREKG